MGSWRSSICSLEGHLRLRILLNEITTCMAKAFYKSDQKECWVPNREPDHDEYYETNDGD